MHQGYNYQPESKAWATKFLTGQSDSLVLAPRPQNSFGSRFVIGEFSFHNRSGSPAVIGIGGRLPIALWSFGTWTEANYAAGVVYTDDSVDAKDADAGDVNLDTVSTANDGFVIGCEVPFNIASLMISQASASGTVWDVFYSVASSNTGFSNNFKSLTNLYVAPSFGAGNTGEQLIWFEPPLDWHKVTPSTAIVNRHGNTVPSQYLLVVKSSTAPDTTRGQLTLAVLGRMFQSTEGVADNNILNNIGGQEIALPPQCDAICAACSVANVQNRVDVKWRYAG